MSLPTHPATGEAAKIPIAESHPAISFGPIEVPSKNRPAPLVVRVVAPVSGSNLPIILLSHGHGPSDHLASYHGYAPVTDFFASRGFVVIQPTHLNSRFYSDLEPSAGDPMFYKTRPADMKAIIDDLDHIGAAVPTLQGRLDKSNIGVIGHSFGAMTTSLLLGSKNTDPRDGSQFSAPDTRIKAGIILGGTGLADGLSESGKAKVPFYDLDYSQMSAPVLVVCGDEDESPGFTFRGAAWHSESYGASPGKKYLMWVKGGKHGFGGLSGWDAAEGDDGSPERLAFVLRMTWAYMKSQLTEGDQSWEKASAALGELQSLGSVEKKGY